jgi:hypothetical protein
VRLFEPFEPDIEVSGLAVPSMVDGFSVFKSIPTRIMLDHGLGSLDANGHWVLDRAAWYPQAAWLAALGTLFEKLGEGVLFQIGQKIPANAVFPPWVIDIHSAIRAVNVAYHANHRKRGVMMFNRVTGKMLDGIGHYGYEAVAERNEIVSDCQLPYPSAYAHGVLTTMARKFEPLATVEYDSSHSMASPETGRYIFRIHW